MRDEHAPTGAMAVLVVILLGLLLFGLAGLIVVHYAYGQEPRTWRVILEWDPNTEPDLAGYRLYENGEQVAEIPAGTETVTRQLPAGTYQWYLTAFDQSQNESLPSNTVGLTLDGIPPAQPVNIRFSVSISVGGQ